MKIVGELRRKGSKYSPWLPAGLRLTDDDADEIAGETAARALRAFRDEVLIPGVWTSEGGASLDSFFVGQCVLQFPKVHKRWAREQRPQRETLSEHADEPTSDRTDPSTNGDPADMVTLHQETLEALQAAVRDDRTREILVRRAAGYSNAEIGALLDTSEKAIEAALNRHRRRVRRTHPFARRKGGRR